MNKIILSVLSIQLFAQPDSRGNIAAILTKPSATNPSANGVHTVNEAQLRRIVTRCLGFDSPIGFKHIVDACGGSVKLTIDATECKEGETYTKSNGETGIYLKNWTKYSNHEVSLGMIGSMKLAELTLAEGVKQASGQYGVSAVSRKAAIAEPAVVDETETEDQPAVVASSNEEGAKSATV